MGGGIDKGMTGWFNAVICREKDLGMGGELDGLVRDGMDKGIEGGMGCN